MLQDNYSKVGNENEIGRTEDLYFGTEVTGQIGVSNDAFGAHTNALMLAATIVRGFEFPHQQQLFLSGDFSTRIEEGRARNLVSDGGAKYYWRWRPDWLLYASLSATVTDSLDPDMQLLLGGDNGLRGYPLRYESGTSRGLLTVEQRCLRIGIHFDWLVSEPLFSRMWAELGSGAVGNSDPGMLSDVGFGLRLGNTRSGLGNVLHIDFAFPLSNIAGIQKFEFLVADIPDLSDTEMASAVSTIEVSAIPVGRVGRRAEVLLENQHRTGGIV